MKPSPIGERTHRTRMPLLLPSYQPHSNPPTAQGAWAQAWYQGARCTVSSPFGASSLPQLGKAFVPLRPLYLLRCLLCSGTRMASVTVNPGAGEWRQRRQAVDLCAPHPTQGPLPSSANTGGGVLMKTNAGSGAARSRVFESRLPSPSCAQPRLHASAHVPETCR